MIQIIIVSITYGLYLIIVKIYMLDNLYLYHNIMQYVKIPREKL